MRLLIVDDDDMYWELIQACIDSDPLLSARVQAQRLDDGAALVAFMQRDTSYADVEVYPWPDLVLLDERMRTLDGLETLKVLRTQALANTTTICMMSSADQPQLVTSALMHGARFCFVKPTNFSELKVRMGKIVDFFVDVAILPQRQARD